MKKKSIIILTFSLLLQISCTAKGAESTKEQASRTFPYVNPPVMITDQLGQISYLQKHFWDQFDFSDIGWMEEEQEMSRALFTYLHLLSFDEKGETAKKELINILQKSTVSPPMELYFIEQFRKFLSDPNSPLRNEELELVVLDFILDSPQRDEATLARARFDRALLLKNRPGTAAADFEFTLQNGQVQRLYSLFRTPIILFFYNPDCDACGTTIDYLKNSDKIYKQLATKKIQILAIYPDRDLTAWKKYLDRIPTDWITGYDRNQSIENDLLYDLKAIPTLYLLDQDKKVVLKDVSVEEVVANL